MRIVICLLSAEIVRCRTLSWCSLRKGSNVCWSKRLQNGDNTSQYNRHLCWRNSHETYQKVMWMMIVFLRLYAVFGLERLGVVLKAHIDNTDKKDSSHYLPLTTACSTKCGIYARSFLNDWHCHWALKLDWWFNPKRDCATILTKSSRTRHARNVNNYRLTLISAVLYIIVLLPSPHPDHQTCRLVIFRHQGYSTTTITSSSYYCLTSKNQHHKNSHPMLPSFVICVHTFFFPLLPGHLAIFSWKIFSWKMPWCVPHRALCRLRV